MQDFVRELLPRLEAFGASNSSGIYGNASSGGNCLLPLSRSQSLALAALVTTLAEHSTWWSSEESPESWGMCGVVGEDSGPRLTVFISATSDRDVSP